MPYDPYDKFRNATGCGQMTGTLGVAQICGKRAKFTVEAGCPFNVNGLACGIHARSTQRWNYTVTSMSTEES
ncbi:hypothetical protein Drose_04385 [Dactylosporangium roseum]|uniref:Uncharacterized protein n=1 Tax=Dactylosporangium roseum TaxID=47989 RepID=A0ABY5Z935_9ACTN|nr:hypothetical protein [Dactylosporangium roseum]UWZ37528.1 hypothetical protein Drose_04385 [Dactylosporangium roseum]